ncbi:hypothetical protein F4678DRAFT_456711 [Xylaria arbuscula]|nr:hypothetical protein F4678DRAFT_456711 [Xylaria arbuscula]
MDKTEFALRYGEFTQYISIEDVKEAPNLAKKNIQKLRHLRQGQPTSFYFSVPLSSGHIAAAEICVCPISNPHSQNPYYEVSARYAPCHQANNESLGDEPDQVCKIVQQIYDTYIVAARWKFTRDCLKSQSPLQESDLTCHQMTQSNFDGFIAHEPSNRHSEAPPDNRRSFSQEDNTQSQSRSRTLRKGPKTKRFPTDVGETASVRPKRPRRSRSTSHITTTIISNVIDGMKRLEELAKHTSLQIDLDIRAIEDKCQDLQGDHERLYEALGDLEASFSHKFKTEKEESKISLWTSWLYAACLRQILYVKGDYKRTRRSNTARLMFSIVNKLLPMEGINALAILPALGMRCSVLSDAAHKGDIEHDRISTIVANGLRGTLVPLPDGYKVCNPAGWISKVTQIDIREAYNHLGMPNLAVLGVDPECSPAEAGKGVMMQQMRHRWSAFESDAKAELTTLQQAFNLSAAGDFEQLAQVIQSNNLKAPVRFDRFLQQAHENSADLVSVLIPLLSETLLQIVNTWLDKKQASPMSTDVISSPGLGIDIDANSLSQYNQEWYTLGFGMEDVNWDVLRH